MQSQPAPDFRKMTDAAAATWSSGDFNEIGRSLMGVAEALCRDADPRPNERVLDVACGTGNVALVAARRYCEVSGIDIAPNLVDRARLRADAEGTPIDFLVGDAQDLPFEDASFDLVTSTFGIIFAPDQETAAAETLRVCRPGGRIALANWMQEGFGKDFFGAHARHAPPPEDTPSPLDWGREAHLRELFGDGIADLQLQPRVAEVHSRSPAEMVATYERYFGPTIRALERLDRDGAQELRADLERVVEKHNSADDGTVTLRADYLQVMAERA